jgi:hypothetical protein
MTLRGRRDVVNRFFEEGHPDRTVAFHGCFPSLIRIPNFCEGRNDRLFRGHRRARQRQVTESKSQVTELIGVVR